MKQILTLLILAMSFGGCRESATKDTLPTEVVQLKEANRFDTLLVIRTHDADYEFSKKGDFIKERVKHSNNNFLQCLIIVVLLFLVLAILIL